MSICWISSAQISMRPNELQRLLFSTTGSVSTAYRRVSMSYFAEPCANPLGWAAIVSMVPRTFSLHASQSGPRRSHSVSQAATRAAQLVPKPMSSAVGSGT